MRRMFILVVILWCSTPAFAGDRVTVGSKNFTESYLLAEIATQLLNARGIDAVHQQGLGGTKICYDALLSGGIDLYPEYTGTITTAILDEPTNRDLNAALAPLGLTTVAPLGFNNTYVLAARREIADEKQLLTIEDLINVSGLNLAFSHEFRARADGWPALAKHYGLSQESVGIEHGLAYQAIESAQIDITDAYSTDGELARYDLRLLEDNRQFFPTYDAVWLVHERVGQRVRAVLGELEGMLNESTMQALNAQAVLDNVAIASVAANFLSERGLVSDATAASDANRWLGNLFRNTWRHLQLAGIAMAAAAAIGVLLALACFSRPRIANAVLSVCSLFQTIPSIALLALMIPLFGIGLLPALVALFLYALLPIVRATITALHAVEPVHLTVADALGMTDAQRRRHVLIPLAMPHILAGLRTAAVISIGTATLAAFVGAGGLGQPIVTGLALNDTGLILQGAVPAAALAIFTDFGFNWLERQWVPKHLRR
ncbi:MAG: glycine betaine ABC transporter substrate-binding protein [Woeseiaceae bacterium]